MSIKGMFRMPLIGVYVILAGIITSRGRASKCFDRTPNGTYQKIPGDNGFLIEINGNRDTYVPAATYTVKISGKARVHGIEEPKSFSHFTLISENSSPSFQINPELSGKFQLLGDVQTRFSDHCTNTVVETSQTEKSEIEVLWTAPPAGSGCIVFKAMVVQESSGYSLDSGGLNIQVCELKDHLDQNNILEKCCACSEAKYEVMFQGLWSKETHPKDFPLSEWLLHFSDVIGASHSFDYRFWKEGSLASKGMSEVAKWGSSRVLESELKSKSQFIRTIIKSRGLWFPNVNGKTFAIFRTDSINHLVSLVSMLGPSPDWIVGVSGLEMCMVNCTWIDNKEMFLYPYDVGVDSGISYESPDIPTKPQAPIRKITTQDPHDPGAPFYRHDSKMMPPLAKLTIKKLREYKKSCPLENSDSNLINKQTQIINSNTDQGTDNEGVTRVGCEVSDWSEWTGCSVTCGKGINSRVRQYIDVFRAQQAGCSDQLDEREMCSAGVPICQGSTNFYAEAPEDWKPDDMCTTTEWTAWSDCSATCGNSFRVRTRRFYNRLGRKQCPHVETVMRQECSGIYGQCSPDQIETINPKCAVTDWSLWSPCSVSCGTGIQVRTRLYRVSYEDQLKANCNIQLMEKGTCTGKTTDCSYLQAESICGQTKEDGPCRGHFPRWYYDEMSGSCLEFVFGGCRGNSNNFLTAEDCERICLRKPDTGRDTNFIGDMFQDDKFLDSLDILAKSRQEKMSQGLNSVFREIEEQRQVVNLLEEEKLSLGVFFTKQNQLSQAQKKLMMMEKQIMMKKRMEAYQQKQRMLDSSPAVNPYNRQFSDSPIQPRYLTEKQQDCELTSWSPWSQQCSATCGVGYRQRFRQVSRPAAGQGKPCSKLLIRKEQCDLPACPARCRTSQWADWGPCSRTCGSDGVQNRYRQVSSAECGADQESRVCLLPCCPGDNYC